MDLGGAFYRGGGHVGADMGCTLAPWTNRKAETRGEEMTEIGLREIATAILGLVIVGAIVFTPALWWLRRQRAKQKMRMKK